VVFYHRKRGDAVKQGEVLCTIHYNSPERLDDARRLVAASFQITREAPTPQPLVRRVIGAPGASAL